MKKISLLFLLSFLISSCGSRKEISELLEGKYSTHLITFDNADPGIDLVKDNLKEILVLFHHRKLPSEIKNHFKLSDTIWNERINFLFGEGLIKKYEDSSFVPTIFVLDEENGSELKKFTDSLGAELSIIAANRIDKIKEAYSKIPSLNKIPFENISMLVLGGIVHDFEQLKIYREQFIKASVPRRGNSNYYMCLLQNKHKSNVPKFFEERYYDYSTLLLGSFASTSFEQNMATYTSANLISDFGKQESEIDSVYRVYLLNEIIKMNQNHAYKPADKVLAGFTKNGVVVNGKSVIPVFSGVELQKAKELCQLTSADIINYFDNRQTVFIKQYLNSQYREETTYKEWMMWVYKMITSKTIDVLTEKSLIKTVGGNTSAFIIKK